MAKKKVKKRIIDRPNDTLNLAAVHWYALTIERVCMQMYVTDRESFAAMKHVLNQTLRSLKEVNGEIVRPCGDCGDGWECCQSDNMCAPTCLDQ